MRVRSFHCGSSKVLQGLLVCTVCLVSPVVSEATPTYRLASGTTIYVDDDAPNDPGPNHPNVSDPLEDGSQQHPYDRVQEGLDLALSEDTVLILAGIYVEDLTYRGHGCVIVGAGAATTTIESLSGLGMYAELWSEGADIYLEIRDLTFDHGSLEVTKTSGYGFFWTTVRVENVRMISGDHIHIHASPDSGASIEISGLDAPDTLVVSSTSTANPLTTLISESTIAGVITGPGGDDSGANLAVRRVRFTGDGISAGGGGFGTHVTVADSVFEKGGITFAGSANEPSAGHGDSVSVRNCEFLGEGFDVNEYFYNDLVPQLSLEVDNCRFVGNGLSLRVLQSRDIYDGAPGHSAVRITNTLFESSPIGIRVRYQYEDDDGDFTAGIGDLHLEAVNNTLSNCGTAFSITTDLRPPGSDTITSILKNNIIAGGGTGIAVLGTDDHHFAVAANDAYGQSVAGYTGDMDDQNGLNGNISADPHFLDPNEGDYSLRQDSPCIDAGQTGPEVPTTDHDGTSRPQDGNGDGIPLPDIGAFEFVYLDTDGDGFPVGADCDDHDPSIHPGAPDLPGNAADDNCDGTPTCDPATFWRNHGDFVRCVSHECNRLVGDGTVSRLQCSALVNQAAESSVGKSQRAGKPRTPPEP
ncbi:MAG TPA: choice-of-anchor Q domain-containing protein [Candidatus Polarisedimenticolia bacterium]